MRTLGYAILSSLAREPLSGYDLKRAMEQRVGYFWSARHSQIYPELARLEGGGFVTHRVVEQRERPDKKVYGITPAGRETLRRWATEPPPARAARDELVLKSYSMWLADPEETAALFREEEQKHEARLRRYREIEAWMKREWGAELGRTDSHRFASYAALRRGIGYERDYAEWCRWVAGSLKKGGRAVE